MRRMSSCVLKGFPMSSSLGESRYTRITAAARSRISDRRRAVRDSVNGEPPRSQLVTMVLATYDEIPGLSLCLDQRHGYLACAKRHAWWFSTTWCEKADSAGQPMASTTRSAASNLDKA